LPIEGPGFYLPLVVFRLCHQAAFRNFAQDRMEGDLYSTYFFNLRVWKYLIKFFHIGQLMCVMHLLNLLTPVCFGHVE